MDRFARSVRGLATLLEQLDAAGVAVRSATEPFDTTTAAGRMMVQMLGVFAEFERATVTDRVISGMEHKAARGEWCGGSRPYGYTVDSTTGYLQVSPDESLLVPIIFDLYVKQHLGAKSIGNWLTERGHRTRSGRPWNHSAVLVSACAITHATLYTLLRVPGFAADLRIIDHDILARSNTNRYPLARAADLELAKVDQLAGFATDAVRIRGIRRRFDEDPLATFGDLAPRVLVGVDDIPTRWFVQRQKPALVGVGATSRVRAAGVSRLSG